MMHASPPNPLDDARVLHANDRFVIVDKPPGVRSVPGNGPDGHVCLEAWVRDRFPLGDGPLTVHRLDMPTSGLMVYALDRPAQAALSVQFMKRRVAKAYTAIVQGRVDPRSGEVSLPLRVDWPNRPRQIVDHDRGKPAHTRWRRLAHETRDARPCTRLELIPVTGRSHQLRVHAAHPDGLNAPILGDNLYGDESLAPRLLLHASMLEINDLETGAPMRFESPAPF
ncbi:MAG: RluA family pseudouridine synthase [Phycisphaerales bacterium JB059]